MSRAHASLARAVGCSVCPCRSFRICRRAIRRSSSYTSGASSLRASASPWRAAARSRTSVSESVVGTRCTCGSADARQPQRADSDPSGRATASDPIILRGPHNCHPPAAGSAAPNVPAGASMRRLHHGVSMPVRVLHVGLGPIGAGIVRAGGGAAGSQDCRRLSTSIRPSQAVMLARLSGSIASSGFALTATCAAALKETCARTWSLLCTSSALAVGRATDRDHPQGQEGHRVDDRGAGLPVVQPAPAGRGHRRCGKTGKGRRARHGRKPWLRHGRTCRSH